MSEPAAKTEAPPAAERPRVLYPDDGPSPPFPLRMEGAVIAGFGRGSKELGIPTANLPVDAQATPWIATATSGVYFGYAALSLPATHPDHVLAAGAGASSISHAGADDTFHVYPMVMSIGYNPFYKNAVRSAEVHVLHRFAADFYGSPMRLLVCGFIREEQDYASLDALVADINIDCDAARRSLDRPAWRPREGVVVAAQEPDAQSSTATGSLDGSWLVRPREPHTSAA